MVVGTGTLLDRLLLLLLGVSLLLLWVLGWYPSLVAPERLP
jgi:hypothetical protein